MSTHVGEFRLFENRNSRICLNFLSSGCQDHSTWSIIHLLKEWHLIFWNPFFHTETFPLGQAIPYTSANHPPNNGPLVIPQCPPGGTYVDHCAAGLEGEENVDVGAVGHASAGGVGQEELQAADQVPGDAHLDGVGPAQHGDCGERAAVRTETRVRGRVRKASRRISFTVMQLQLFFLSSRESMRLETSWWTKPGLPTPKAVVESCPWAWYWPNEEILCSSSRPTDSYVKVWLAYLHELKHPKD